MIRNPFHGQSLAWMAAAALAAQAVLVAGQAPPGAPASSPASPAPATQPQASPEQVGDSLMVHQRYQAAIEQYKNAPRDSVDVWNKMGVAYQLMLNNTEAYHCYQVALKLNPKSAVALNNIASVHMGLKEYTTAEHFYRKAVKLDPGSALFLKNLGTALLAERKYKKGWEAYQEALAIDPQVLNHSGSARIQNPSTVQDRGAMNFYMAKGCVKAGMPDKAVYYLRLALNEGFTTPRKIMADAELATLRDNPEFQQMLAAQGVYLTNSLPPHQEVQQ